MRKDSVTGKKMLLASLIALAAFGAIGTQAYAAPTPTNGANATYAFGEGTGSAQTTVNWATVTKDAATGNLSSTISQSVVNMITDTGVSGKYILTPNADGAMSLLGNKYNVTGADSVTVFNDYDTYTTSIPTILDNKFLITGLSNAGVSDTHAKTDNSVISGDIINNSITTGGYYKALLSIGSATEGATYTVKSNIIANNVDIGDNSFGSILQLYGKAAYSFEGDIIGNNITAKQVYGGIVDSNVNSLGMTSFRGDIIGNTMQVEDRSKLFEFYVVEDQTLNFTSNVLNNNITTTANSSDVMFYWLNKDSNVNIENSLFSGNVSTDGNDQSGFLVYAQHTGSGNSTNATFKIKNTDFVNNTINSGQWGGLANPLDVNFVIEDSNFINNTINGPSQLIRATNGAVVTVSAINKDVLFDNNYTADNARDISIHYEGYFNANDGHSLVLKNGISSITGSRVYINKDGQAGNVVFGDFYGCTDLTIGGGTFTIHTKEDAYKPSVTNLIVGSDVTLNMQGDNQVGWLSLRELKRQEGISSAQLKLDLDYNGTSNRIDHLYIDPYSGTGEDNIKIKLNSVNVFSDSSADEIADVTYVINADKLAEGTLQAATVTAASSGGYLYTFATKGDYNEKLGISRVQTTTHTLRDYITDASLSNGFNITTADYNPFTGQTYTDLGTLAGTGREFTLNGNDRTIDGSYVSDGNTLKGGGVTILEGQTFNVDKVSEFKNFNQAIKNSGTLVVDKTTFKNNSVTGKGAALYNKNAATITNSAFTGNTSSSYGGAVYVNTWTDEQNSSAVDGVTTITDTEFTNNRGYIGGALFVHHGKVNLENVTISGNTADYGGGLYMASSNDASLSIKNSTIRDNVALETGAIGGMSHITLDNVKIIGNKATNSVNSDGGGAMFIGSIGKVDITGGEFTNNTVAAMGGAIATRGTLTTQGTFSENNSAATLDINGVSFSGNVAATNGGAIDNKLYNDKNNDGYVYIGSSSSFTNNKAEKGGAIYNHGETDIIGNVASMYITNTSFTGNSASSDGGAIYNAGKIVIDNVTFSNNKSGVTYTYENGDITAIDGGVANDIYNIGSLSIAGTTSISGGISDNTTNLAGTTTVLAGGDVSLGSSATFAQKSLTIHGEDTANSLDAGKFTATAKQVSGIGDTSVTNNGTLTLFGSTDNGSGILQKSITGDSGTTVINGDIGSLSSIAQDISILGRQSLNIAASNVGGNVSIADGGELFLWGGIGLNTEGDPVFSTGTHTFNNEITGDGTTTISDGLILTLGDDAKLNNVVIAADTGKNWNGGALTAALDQITGTLDNKGTLNLKGALTKDIAGAGETVLDSDQALTADRTVSGTLNLNGHVINMQDSTPANNVYASGSEPTTFQTLTVGSLKGDGSLKIDVDMTTASGKAKDNDKIVITDGTNNSGTITLSSINVTDSGDTSNTEYSNYITYVSGKTNNLNFDTSSITTITSDNRRFTFTNANNGSLNVKIREAVVTLSQFVQGDDLDGRTGTAPAESINTFSFVDNVTVEEDIGKTHRDTAGEIYINVNEHVLDAAGNKSIAGVEVDNAYTLNLSGKSATEQGTMKNFSTALTVDAGGNAVVSNMKFEGNGQDITNNSTTDTALTFNGTNSLETGINGSGNTHISDNASVSISSTADDALTQNSVTVGSDATLTASANALNVTNGITNSGTVKLNAGTLDTAINGGNISILGNVTTDNAGNLAGAIANASSTLELKGGNISGAISGDGTTKINGTVTNTGNNSLGNAITLESGAKLTTGASTIQKAVTSTTGAEVVLNEGTLNQTITGGKITIAGNVDTNANNLAGTETNNASSKLTLTGGDIKANITGGGDTEITGAVTNTTNKEIYNVVAVTNTGSLNTKADAFKNTVTNDGTITLNGGTLAQAIDNSATPNTNAKTVIDGSVISNAAINQAIQIESGKDLTIAVTNVGGAVSNDEGTLNLTGTGTLNNAITGDGNTVIKGNVTNGSTVANAVEVAAAVGSAPAGSLTTPASTVTGGINNNGSVTLTDGEGTQGALASNVTSSTGDGNTTVTGNVSVASDKKIENQDKVNVGNNTTKGTLTNSGMVSADEINVASGSKLSSTGSDSKTQADKVNVASGTVELNDGAKLTDTAGTGSSSVDFTGGNNTLALNATNADTTLQDTNITSSDGRGYAVTASSANDNEVTINNAIADATSVTASDNTKLTLTDTAVNSTDADVSMGSDSTLTLDNTSSSSDDMDVASAISGNGYTVEVVNSADGKTNLKNTIAGATSVLASGGTTNIEAGSDSSTSARIGNAALNVDSNSDVNVNTTADNFTVNNNVNGVDNSSSTVALNGNGGTAGSASNSGTQFTVANGTTVSNVNLAVNSGELIMPNESALNNSTISVANGATLNTMNGSTSSVNTPVTLADGSQVKVDVNALSGAADNFANATQNSGDGVVLTDVALQDLNKVLRKNTTVDLAKATNLNNLTIGDELLNKTFTEMTAIRKMTASFTEDGMMHIAPSSGHNNWKDFNPSILATPIAAQLGGYLTQLNSYDEAFRNMDMYMLMTKKQRQAMKMRNKFAAATTEQSLTFDPNQTMQEHKAGWFRPYATFEKVGLKNGPKVSNVAYGSFFGGDSEIIDLGHGWDGVYSVYAGYNGSHQSYNGISIYQNGGTLGLTGMAYKGDFFTGLTINAGSNVGEASTYYGNDDFTMLMAGIASKTGYNWELADGKFIIQPSYMMSYSFVNTFDYTNSAGVRVNSDPLHAVHIEPGIKFIGNLKNGWQPYVGVSFVWNIMDKTDFKANDIALPDMSVKPYVKYGVGVRKTWGERFTAFFQTFFTNGGRNGVGLQAGLRWSIGRDSSKKANTNGKTSEAKPTRTVIKSAK